ncbi:MAG: 7-carboxy-7-deazaguanine synthase [Desulforhopalus sp.]|jgi:7-carboxy-7-deazaguanine synthase
MLEVTELFSSLQGEGPFAGRPAVFVRLSRCIPPLCPWCDSAFAWQAGERIAVDLLVQQVLAYNCSFVVVTGGEPFLQWTSGLQELAEKLIHLGCSIQYETSGKVIIPEVNGGFVVCSPKYLENTWCFKEQNCEEIDAFKFVVDDEFEPVDDFIEHWQIPASKVWIMARGTTRTVQLQHMQKIWNYCVERGFNFSPRLHTLAFDNRKGV